MNKLMLLIGALVLLVGVAFLSGAFERNATTVDVPDIVFAEDDVEAIRIESTEATIVLRKDGDVWRMAEPVGAAVEVSTISSLTRSLGDFGLDHVVSSNPDRFGRYGIDSTATKLTVTTNGQDRMLIVSEQGPDFQSTYVQPAGTDKVFASKGRLHIVSDANQWRDKTVTQFAATEMRSVRVARPGVGYTLENDGGQWRFENGTTAAADSAKTARWLNRYSNFRADGFLDDVPADSIREGASSVVTFTDASGVEHRLYLASLNGDHAVVLDDGNVVYKLLKTRVSTLVPEVGSLSQ